MKKITIAVDSFKGSLSSREVADAFGQGFASVADDVIISKVAVADGGEGTVEAIVSTLGGSYVEVEVADPLMRPIVARYGLVDGDTTAIIEMSAASGLPLLRSDERNPLFTTTYGTGQLIADALRRGARRILLGIGGSATNDAGVGMLRALGFRFLDSCGADVKTDGASLGSICSIDASEVMPLALETEFVVACDVNNPLYGERGAACVFARQKGADDAAIERLDSGLRQFAEVVRAYNGCDLSTLAGAGAAGGLGGGAMALLGARMERGIEMVLGAIGFDSLIEGSDLVITGEGCIDRQTLMGKAPSGVLSAASRRNIPVIAICGAVEPCDELAASGFAAIYPINEESVPLEIAMQPDVAAAVVRRTAAKIAQEFL